MVMLPEILAAVAVVTFTLAEWLHARRVRRLAGLAFGPRRKARAWTLVAPPLRVLAGAGAAWALTSLYFVEPKVYKVKEAEPNRQRHVIIVLDVSPSMKLEDAGPDGKQRRSKRASELMLSFFQRVPMELVKLTVIATYTSAKPVVIDTKDAEVVKNIIDDLPLSHAFNSGNTNLFAGIEEAARIAKTWERNSTTVLILTDGDTVPPTGMPRLPPSVVEVVLAGVGDPRAGKFISGRQSRQEAAALQQIAVRLKGTYFDANARHLPTELLRRVTAVPEPGFFERLTRREYALAVLTLSSLLLAGLPWALRLWGTGWRPGARLPPSSSPVAARPPAARESVLSTR